MRRLAGRLHFVGTSLAGYLTGPLIFRAVYLLRCTDERSRERESEREVLELCKVDSWLIHDLH